MKLYQLFKCVPTEEFMRQLLGCFGLDGLQDHREFSKRHLRDHNTVERLYDMLPELVLYYIPCKAKKYLDDVDEDRAITILRQFLRLFDFKLTKKERVVQRRKIIYYSLQPVRMRIISIQSYDDMMVTLD